MTRPWGRPGSDPAVRLGLWLDGIGSARAMERLCEAHAADRWLCGGVPVNHDMLSSFRREGGERLDALLTQSLTGLIAEGLINLAEVAIDGTQVRARAGPTAPDQPRRTNSAGRTRAAGPDRSAGRRPDRGAETRGQS